MFLGTSYCKFSGEYAGEVFYYYFLWFLYKVHNYLCVTEKQCSTKSRFCQILMEVFCSQTRFWSSFSKNPWLLVIKHHCNQALTLTDQVRSPLWHCIYKHRSINYLAKRSQVMHIHYVTSLKVFLRAFYVYNGNLTAAEHYSALAMYLVWCMNMEANTATVAVTFAHLS